MNDEEVADEVSGLVEEIIRISGGGTEVTFGALFEDDRVQNRFEALVGTLKAAKKKNLITFDGEILLQGRDDAKVIRIIDSHEAESSSTPAEVEPASKSARKKKKKSTSKSEAAAPVEEPLPAEEPAPAEASVVEATPTPVEESPAGEAAPAAPPPTETEPDEAAAAPPPEPASAEPAPAEPAPAEPAPAEPAPVEPASAEPVPAEPAPAEPAPAEPAPAEPAPAEPAPAEPAPAEPAPAEAAAQDSAHSEGPEAEKAEELTDESSKKWNVDISYIDHRTADPNRLEPRRSLTEDQGAEKSITTSVPASVKEKDGTWKQVDVGYINYRTADPDRLEPRRNANEDQGAEKTAVGGQSAKAEDGSWKQVDVGYINHRTAQVDNLEGRKKNQHGLTTSLEPGAGGVGAGLVGSGTVKKEVDGKWRVDTSYIGYRTGDTNNLTRKEEKLGDGDSYADPAEKKYSLEEIQGANRPSDVDPKRREQYLSEEEFQAIFSMSLDEFAKLAKWRQQNLKKAKDLF